MKKIKLIIVLFVLFSCEKVAQNNETVTIPESPADLTVKQINSSSVELNWIDRSTNENSFIVERKIKNENFNQIGKVVENISKFVDSNLNINETYTYRVYSSNNKGKSATYSNEQTINIKSVPIISTIQPSKITRTSFFSGGNISNDGGSLITQRGVVWGTQPSPTIELNTKIISTNQLNVFETQVPNLKPNTIYYVRSFASNSSGVGYGNEIQLKTNQVQLATLKTWLVDTSVSYTSAIINLQVLEWMDGTCSSNGLCISTKPNPTLADSVILGPILCKNSVTYSYWRRKLIPNTKYYVRGFAVNEAGVAYSNEISFTTLQSDYVLFDSRDNTSYPVKIIGNQHWLAQNLEITSPIFNNKVSDTYWEYDPKFKYGNVYSFLEINNVCPIGWRTPTTTDYQILINSLGGPLEAGVRLKSKTREWKSWLENTNPSGFNAFPLVAARNFWEDVKISNLAQYVTSDTSLITIFDSKSPILIQKLYFLDAKNYYSTTRCIKK